MSNHPVVCVVRLQTEFFQRGNSFNQQKSIRVLKKLSNYDLITEEVSSIGVRDAMENIINLNECADGVYQIVTCNESRDIESGYLDDWNFMLVPYKENPT